MTYLRDFTAAVFVGFSIGLSVAVAGDVWQSTFHRNGYLGELVVPNEDAAQFRCGNVRVVK